jgi:hypothetical protein
MAFADSIRNWLWRGSEAILDQLSGHDDNMAAEFGELKKLVRRQGIQQESLVREISAKLDTLASTGGGKDEGPLSPDSLMALAESYFHLEAALAHTEIGAEILEALALIREKLDDVCFEADLEIIRESGVPFDSRRHEALDRAPDGEPPVVRSVTAPGFMHNGRVLRAARVMLTEESNISDQSESEEFYGE